MKSRLLLPAILLALGCENDGDASRLKAIVVSERGIPAVPVSYAIRMSPLNQRGPSGAAQFEREGNRTWVTVELSGGVPGRYEGYIHLGADCNEIGAPVVTLLPIALDEAGRMTEESPVDMRLEAVMNDRHLVVYHLTHGDSIAPAACGDIPRIP